MNCVAVRNGTRVVAMLLAMPPIMTSMLLHHRVHICRGAKVERAGKADRVGISIGAGEKSGDSAKLIFHLGYRVLRGSAGLCCNY